MNCIILLTEKSHSSFLFINKTLC